ncbi:MAG: nodulation protein NfeD [Dehalococcoidia bacterium]|nr:nodulation protein NfeD [Dehalococcoidia bacterium]
MRLIGVLSLLAGLALLWVQPVLAQAPAAREAYVVRVNGVINPVVARYAVRNLHTAEQRGAEVFVLTLDTPGGLDSSMREIVQGLLNAKVPTVVFVSPRGARAASAGVFLVAASHVGVMVPGTSIGAATPVALGAELPETLARKATNDAAAYIREIALLRGRNADWLESTVRTAAAVPATEALQLGAIDLIVGDLDQLLQALDGRTVTLDGEQRTLRTADARVVTRGMSVWEQLLNFAADPTVATLLISLGSLALISELFHASIVVGVLGGVALALGLVGVGNLPVNWVGVALILTGGVLLALELLHSGWGVLGVGSLICFIVGMVLLFSTYQPSLPGGPDFRVSPWVIAFVSAIIGALILLFTAVALRTGRIVALPREAVALVGRTGVVTSDLAPRGTVLLESEVWTAVSAGGQPITAGERVEVVGVEELVLTVRRAS